MNTVIIFIPSYLYQKHSGRLEGSIQKFNETCVTTYFILGLKEISSTFNLHPSTEDRHLQIIGQYSKACHFPRREKDDTCLMLGIKCNEFTIHKLICEGENVNLFSSHRLIVIVYDYSLFLEAELLLSVTEYDENGRYKDYFKILVSSLKSNQMQSSESQCTMAHYREISIVIDKMLCVVNLLFFMMQYMIPVLKYSSLGLRLHNFLEGLSWSLTSVRNNKRITLKTGNYIVAILIDVCSGLFILYAVMSLLSSSHPSQMLLEMAEVVVDALQKLLKWLMGIPAGLKLNFTFNNTLGNFFLYHINLWRTFLVLAAPVLDLIFQIFLCLGCFGLTFQAAIIADLLALASFHVYCIYVYAARLYNLQMSGLVALWRLFLGRKYNPLRERVDSCHYSANQLFIGTLAFTILLFLLPTTLMYYIVFTTISSKAFLVYYSVVCQQLRLMVAALAGLLSRIQLLLQTLPLYVSCLWLLRSPRVNASLKLQVKSRLPGEPLLLSAVPVPTSWWATVQNCMPEPVQLLPPVQWSSLIKNIATGSLIYPL